MKNNTITRYQCNPHMSYEKSMIWCAGLYSYLYELEIIFDKHLFILNYEANSGDQSGPTKSKVVENIVHAMNKVKLDVRQGR